MSINDYIYWQTVYETGKTPEEIYEYEHPKVVRCKECKKNPKWSYVGCPMPQKTDLENDYCSYGEREGE